MGETYNLSQEELQIYRNRILEQLNKWETEKSIENLILFLIWIYEFTEMYAVNGTRQQAMLKPAKQVFGTYFEEGFVFGLFKMRAKLVHKSYAINTEMIIKYFVDNEDKIRRLMKLLDFPVTRSVSAF